MSARRERVSTAKAPAAIGPYSQAILSENFLFCSGQIGLDPSTGELVPGGAAAECRRAMENLGAVLEAAGLDYADVIKTTIYVIRMEEFAAVNGEYASFFTEPYPARATVAVAALPKGARVEIEAVARLQGTRRE